MRAHACLLVSAAVTLNGAGLFELSLLPANCILTDYHHLAVNHQASAESERGSKMCVCVCVCGCGVTCGLHKTCRKYTPARQTDRQRARRTEIVYKIDSERQISNR